MEKQMLRNVAKEKIEFHKAEVKRWEEFLSHIENDDVIVLKDNEPMPMTFREPIASPQPLAPATSSAGASQPKPGMVAKKNGTGDKYPWASSIRKFFAEAKSKKALNRDIAGWVVKDLHIPKKDSIEAKKRIYAQLKTFEKFKRGKSGKDEEGRATFTWKG